MFPASANSNREHERRGNEPLEYFHTTQWFSGGRSAAIPYRLGDLLPTAPDLRLFVPITTVVRESRGSHNFSVCLLATLI